MRFGIIGGTGFYDLGDAAASQEATTVETPYGAVCVQPSPLAASEVAFIARHGLGHTVPPHRINYRANIAALRELGVTNILASAAVGSLSDRMPPGSLALLTQFLDFTRGRPSTFFDGEDGEVVHVDVSDPYCRHLRAELEKAASRLGEKLHLDATYVCAEGPRFETPAEIRMFRRLGGDVVGMTGVPEVVLAREAGICYASVAIVTNWAAGVSGEGVKHDSVSEFMEAQTPRVRGLFEEVVSTHQEIDCSCRSWIGK